MRQKKRKKNQFEMFKDFKYILRLFNKKILYFFDLKFNLPDFICFLNLIQIQIFDYILYRIFKKCFVLQTCFSNNYLLHAIFYKFRFNECLTDILCIGNFSKNKYYWTNFTYNPIKFFNVLKNNFKKLNFFKKISSFNKISTLQLYINMKRQTGVLKRKDKFTYNTLVNVNFIKNIKYYNTSSIVTRNIDFSKMFEMKRKTLKIFFLNRDLLRKFFFMSNYRQNKLTKFFSKNLNKSVNKCIVGFEFSVVNLLIKSKFVLTHSDAIFLIKNNLVYVNGVVCNNIFKQLVAYDTITLVFTAKYYYFFKTVFNSKLKLSSFLSYRLWRYNRFRSNFYKQSPSSLPVWINKMSHFYFDVPLYLEIDYTTLSLFLLKTDCTQPLFFSKFMNIFLFRLYNWKYLN